MIIVSQDRLRISENMEIGVYPEYENCKSENIICYKVENDYMLLGEYKTVERAKEVLEEIAILYEHSEHMKCNKTSVQQYAKPDFIYEMPAE